MCVDCGAFVVQVDDEAAQRGLSASLARHRVRCALSRFVVDLCVTILRSRFCSTGVDRRYSRGETSDRFHFALVDLMIDRFFVFLSTCKRYEHA
jgi:hypothetical protein